MWFAKFHDRIRIKFGLSSYKILGSWILIEVPGIKLPCLRLLSSTTLFIIFWSISKKFKNVVALAAAPKPYIVKFFLFIFLSNKFTDFLIEIIFFGN